MLKTLGHFIAIILPTMFILTSGATASDDKPIIIGLDADMSAGGAIAGLAIQRGAELAIDEINANGGVMGRFLQLKVKNHRGNPVRGVDNIRSFAAMDDVVAVLGGMHTPVAMHELEIIHENKIIYLSPWAAGTGVVENGYDPNYVFRVSIRDEYAGSFLVGEALKRGYRRVALALEKTAWGRSNEQAMGDALAKEGLSPTTVAWFHWGSKNMETAINKLLGAKPDVILLVSGGTSGLGIVNAMASRPGEDRVPIVSHWGITGGNFFDQIEKIHNDIDLSVLQTYSFVKPPFPDRAEKVIDAYLRRYPDAVDVSNIIAPTGTAHAYDIIHLLALAIARAGTSDRQAVHKALEHMDDYQGLVRNYTPAFSTTKHDALDAHDFNLSKYNKDGVLVPLR